MSSQRTEFDFDRWKALAESDAEAFERERRALLQAEIERAPAGQQQRLRGLQWQIDMIRRRCRTPVQASTRLFEMMWQQVYGDDGFVDVLTSGRAPRRRATPVAEASVLPFKRRAAMAD